MAIPHLVADLADGTMAELWEGVSEGDDARTRPCSPIEFHSTDDRIHVLALEA